MKINIDGAVAELNQLSAQLSDKANMLDSTVLTTDDDTIANLKEALLQAVEKLNKDIENLKNNANGANRNQKW